MLNDIELTSVVLDPQDVSSINDGSLTVSTIITQDKLNVAELLTNHLNYAVYDLESDNSNAIIADIDSTKSISREKFRSSSEKRSRSKSTSKSSERAKLNSLGKSAMSLLPSPPEDNTTSSNHSLRGAAVPDSESVLSDKLSNKSLSSNSSSKCKLLFPTRYSYEYYTIQIMHPLNIVNEWEKESYKDILGIPLASQQIKSKKRKASNIRSTSRSIDLSYHTDRGSPHCIKCQKGSKKGLRPLNASRSIHRCT